LSSTRAPSAPSELARCRLTAETGIAPSAGSGCPTLGPSIPADECDDHGPQQVGAVVRTLDEASRPGTAITRDTLLAQLDGLVLDVVKTLEGDAEVEVVRELLHLRAAITEGRVSDDQAAAVAAARGELTTIVNTFFYDKLTGLPSIADYMVNAGG
jgi:hypothetical protein